MNPHAVARTMGPAAWAIPRLGMPAPHEGEWERVDEPRDLDGLPEEALLDLAVGGDTAACGALFDRYGETLVRFARRWLPTDVQRTMSAVDVVQEAHLVALRRLAEFEPRGEGSLRNWLLQIVRFKVQEAVRRHARRGRREAPASRRGPTEQIPARGPSPSAAALGSEVESLADRAFASLPEDYREVLRMARREGLTLREIAERLGRTREAVKKTYGRALARFTEEFERLREDHRG